MQDSRHASCSQDRISEQRAKRERFLALNKSSSIKKGLIRYLVLVVDLSRACSSEHLDLRPNRHSCMIRVVRRFIRDYFDQNPLSQLGIMITRDGIAIKLTDLSGSPEAQVKKLNESNLGSSGDASLQNVLDLGLTMLESVPPYGHREVSHNRLCIGDQLASALTLCSDFIVGSMSRSLSFSHHSPQETQETSSARFKRANRPRSGSQWSV